MITIFPCGFRKGTMVSIDDLSSSFITPLAADNKIHRIHIKYIKIGSRTWLFKELITGPLKSKMAEIRHLKS